MFNEEIWVVLGVDVVEYHLLIAKRNNIKKKFESIFCLFTSDDFVNIRNLLTNWWVGEKEFLVNFVSIISSVDSSFKLSDDNKVWLAEAINRKYLFFFVVLENILPITNCPLILTSAVDERGESFDAPAKELIDELNDGAVRGGRRGRTLVN